jgi:hypothetical protein
MSDRTSHNKPVCASGLSPHAPFARTSHTAGMLCAMSSDSLI